MLVEKSQPVVGDEALDIVIVPAAKCEGIAEFDKVAWSLDADGKGICAVSAVEIAAKADAIAALHTFAQGFDLCDGVIEGGALFESVGVEELLSDAGVQALVVPNPATDEANLMVSLLNGGDTRVELMEPTGRVVQVLAQQQLAPGTHQWNLPLERLAGGVYLVRVQQDGVQRVVRFTKE